ncbi:serine/threonine-protein phosphatase CPPED1-like [Clavelina lepadiformis]|uniref:Calcineurin-like phosphoesterase domain-containing protein n=1 Tax=Clavelina lepadiformis TaxID=159417 RepID=A0ABP0GVD2_CLALP
MTNEFVKVANHEASGFTKEEQGRWTESYEFVFVADPQPGLIHQYDGGDGSLWDEEVKNIQEAALAINKMQPKPKFLVIGGDILNAFPGTPYRSEQLRDLRVAFSQLNTSIPIFAVSGNHDLGQKPTLETMEMYRRDFGDEYYTFWYGGIFYIVINTQCIISPDGTENLYETQKAWLEEQLKIALSSSCKHVVLFMHIPLFVKNPEEEDTGYAIPMKHRFKLMEQFADAGIEKVFSGHYHRNAGGFWTRTNPDGSLSKVEVVASSSIGKQIGNQGDKAGIRIVKVSENEITHHYYAIRDIP